MASNTQEIYEPAVAKPLVPLTLRVGITGHRPNKLDANDLASLNSPLAKSISRVYRKIFSVLGTLAEDERAAQFYDVKQAPVLRLISSLAEGADRICVDKAMVDGEFELACILPFTKEEYENDFVEGNSLENSESGTVSAYNDLLALAEYGTENSRVLELALDRGDATEAYRTCGEYLVDHSDIILAIFDGEHNGLAGTSAVVQRAQKLNVPVIVINPAKPKDVRVISCEEFPGGKNCESEFSKKNLKNVVGRELLFEELTGKLSPDSVKQIGHRFQQYEQEGNLAFDETQEPDLDYSGPINLAQPFAWFIPPLFSWLKSFLASESRVAKKLKSWNLDVDSESSKAVDLSQNQVGTSTHRFYAAFLRADRLATGYATVHRSIYVWIYVLGAVALLTAAAALLAKATALKLGFAFFELAVLGAIYLLYKADHRNQYHRKWLEYRSLAEVLRPQVYLSLTGANLDMESLHDLENIAGMDKISMSGPGRSWMYLYTETLIRWAGFSGQRMDKSRIEQTGSLVCDIWLAGQRNYHTKNAAAMQCMEDRLAKIGHWSFFLTVIVVLMKIPVTRFHLGPEWIGKGLGYLAAAFPVCGTTSFGIRNHAEFEISAQRSLTRRMFFGRRIERLSKLDKNASLKELTQELRDISHSAINETSEWQEIYKVKDSEPA